MPYPRPILLRSRMELNEDTPGVPSLSVEFEVHHKGMVYRYAGYMLSSGIDIHLAPATDREADLAADLRVVYDRHDEPGSVIDLPALIR